MILDRTPGNFTVQYPVIFSQKVEKIENFDLLRNKQNKSYILYIRYEKKIVVYNKKKNFFHLDFLGQSETFFHEPNTFHFGCLKP